MSRLVHARYAALFTVLGLAQIYLAVEHRGIGWLLAWSGASFLAAGAAYAWIGPGLFGKQPDGTFHTWNVTFMLPYLLFTWSLWYVQRLVSHEPSYHQVVPGVWLGRRPFVTELPEGVSLVVDLTAEFPPSRGMKTGRKYLCLPTLDYTAPNAEQFVELVRTVSEWKEPVYLHCAVGHGRSATLAAAVLIARGLARDIDGAVALLVAARPRVRLNAAQRRLLDTLPPNVPPNAAAAGTDPALAEEAATDD